MPQLWWVSLRPTPSGSRSCPKQGREGNLVLQDEDQEGMCVTLYTEQDLDGQVSDL